MTADRWFVLATGLALIGFIAWFFWFKRSTGVRAAEVSGGYQEAMILVKGGYTPDTIVVRHGKPVRLNFRREETASCSDKVIFADFNKSADAVDIDALDHGGLAGIRGWDQHPGDAAALGLHRHRQRGLDRPNAAIQGQFADGGTAV